MILDSSAMNNVNIRENPEENNNIDYKIEFFTYVKTIIEEIFNNMKKKAFYEYFSSDISKF